ncbi:MAG: hypothetical protein U9M90_01150, partial [Patescibacteria group bacterium]|nr:hypothetical protein [Patescibacteria group bacterium]
MPRLLKKIILNLRYPKLLLFTASLLLGCFIYVDGNAYQFHSFVGNFSFRGIFITGLLFSHGLTAGPAIATLLIIGETHAFFLSGIFATAGAIIGNAIVYQKLRLSYEDEFRNLSKCVFLKQTVNVFSKITPSFVRKYILPAFAGFLTATPFPDEFSTALVRASKDMSVTVF